MGFHSYLCGGCNKGLKFNGFKGQQVILKHIRHGEVIDTIQGEYNGYGQVDRDCWENHDEVLHSQWELEDSIDFNKKVYKGQFVDWLDFRLLKAKERGIEMIPGDGTWVFGKDLTPEVHREWKDIPNIKVVHPRSGVEAWHVNCHEAASKERLDAHIISKNDPYQGMGNLR